MIYLAFDIDGTIFDCGDIIVQAFQDGITEFLKQRSAKIEVPSKEQIISVIGQPTDLIFKQLFPELMEYDLQRLNDLCTDSLSDKISLGGGSLFEGVYDTLKNFYSDGYKLLIASNGREKYIQAILQSNNLAKFFTLPIIYIEKKITNKTDILRHYKSTISKDRPMIMIGDRLSDRIAAFENNMPFIGCAFGHANNKEIKGSTWIAHDFKSIYEIVKKIEENDFNTTNS